MKFLQRLLGTKTGGPPNPTIDWPEPQNVELNLVPHEGRLGNLRFGASIENARIFGKPSRFRWIRNNYCELLYAQAGFQIDFDGGQFGYMAFFINRHVAEPDIAGGFDLAIVNLLLADGGTGQLTKESKRDVIEGYYGTATRIDDDDDEIVLHYEIAGVTMEFELDPNDKTLMRLNLYANTNG